MQASTRIRFAVGAALFALITAASVIALNERPEGEAWMAIAAQAAGFAVLGWALRDNIWLLAGAVFVPALVAEPFGDPGWGADGGPPLLFIGLALIPVYGAAGVGAFLLTRDRGPRPRSDAG